jgi:hypothetical protein
MAVGRVCAFGMAVAVGTVGSIGGVARISCVGPGLGMYMGAQLDGAGVAGAVQLERSSANKSRVKQR